MTTSGANFEQTSVPFDSSDGNSSFWFPLRDLIPLMLVLLGLYLVILSDFVSVIGTKNFGSFKGPHTSDAVVSLGPKEAIPDVFVPEVKRSKRVPSPTAD